MSDSFRRRVRHRAGTQTSTPADPTRVILRRRRCSEPSAPGSSTHRRRVDNARGKLLLAALVVVGAGPLWAVSGVVTRHYHEEIARVFHRPAAARAAAVADAAPTGAATAATPDARGNAAASRGGGSGSTFASAWGNAAGLRPPAAPANAPARASAPRMGNAPAASFPAHAVSRPDAHANARARPAVVAGPSTWSGGSAAASPDWSTGGNWTGGTPPANDGSANVAYTPATATATASRVDVNYAINALTFQAGTPAYVITGASGVSLTVGAGGITDDSVNPQSLAVPVVLGAAQTWNVSDARGALSAGSPVSGTGGITKTGAGTLTLAANNTHSGTTYVAGGTLLVTNAPVAGVGSGTGSGSVFVGPGARLGGTGTIGGDTFIGTPPTISPAPLARQPLAAPAVTAGVLAPGVNGAGRLTINGNLTLVSGASDLEVDLAGVDPGTGYDQVRVSGLLSLGGTLTLTLGSGFTPTTGEKFYLIGYAGTAGISGTFDGLPQGATVEDNAGGEYMLSYTDSEGNGVPGNDVSLTALGVPEPGAWTWLGLGAAGGVAAAARRRWWPGRA